jgi:serine/threonine protein kinase
MLFELYTGKKPFDTSSGDISRLWEKVRNFVITPWPPGCDDEEMRSLILWCLRRDWTVRADIIQLCGTPVMLRAAAKFQAGCSTPVPYLTGKEAIKPCAFPSKDALDQGDSGGHEPSVARKIAILEGKVKETPNEKREREGKPNFYAQHKAAGIVQ